jgi:hypothetical protein
MRVIDSNLPCETPGNIELIALDSIKRLTVVDVDDKPNDSLLLRGMAHLDWGCCQHTLAPAHVPGLVTLVKYPGAASYEIRWAPVPAGGGAPSAWTTLPLAGVRTPATIYGLTPHRERTPRGTAQQ